MIKDVLATNGFSWSPKSSDRLISNGFRSHGCDLINLVFQSCFKLNNSVLHFILAILAILSILEIYIRSKRNPEAHDNLYLDKIR